MITPNNWKAPTGARLIVEPVFFAFQHERNAKSLLMQTFILNLIYLCRQ
jgi:hypothetical protein